MLEICLFIGFCFNCSTNEETILRAFGYILLSQGCGLFQSATEVRSFLIYSKSKIKRLKVINGRDEAIVFYFSLSFMGLHILSFNVYRNLIISCIKNGFSGFVLSGFKHLNGCILLARTVLERDILYVKYRSLFYKVTYSGDSRRETVDIYFYFIPDFLTTFYRVPVHH